MDRLCQGHAGCIKAVNFSQHAKAGGPGIQPVRSILASNKAPIVSTVWDSIPIWETYIYIYIYIYLFLGSRGPIILTGLPVLVNLSISFGFPAGPRQWCGPRGPRQSRSNGWSHWDWVGNVDPEWISMSGMILIDYIYNYIYVQYNSTWLVDTPQLLLCHP